MSPRKKDKEKGKQNKDKDEMAVLPTAGEASASTSASQSPQPTPDSPVTSIKEDIIQAVLAGVKTEIDRAIKEIKEDTKEDIKKLTTVMIENFERVDDAIQDLERKMEDGFIMAEPKQIQFAIRIRGFRESVKEDLEMEIATGLAAEMEEADEEIY